MIICVAVCMALELDETQSFEVMSDDLADETFGAA